MTGQLRTLLVTLGVGDEVKFLLGTSHTYYRTVECTEDMLMNYINVRYPLEITLRLRSLEVVLWCALIISLRRCM